jgi:hypothetical protein
MPIVHAYEGTHSRQAFRDRYSVRHPGIHRTVWADHLTRLREVEGTSSDAYVAAVKIMDDMLWSSRRNGAPVKKPGYRR